MASSSAIDPTEPRPDSSLAKEDSIIEDNARSETGSSRAGSVAEESKKPELQTGVKKASAIKPVSFAKYQVVKNTPTGAAAKPVTTSGALKAREAVLHVYLQEDSDNAEFGCFRVATSWTTTSRCKNCQCPPTESSNIQKLGSRSDAGMEQE